MRRHAALTLALARGVHTLIGRRSAHGVADKYAPLRRHDWLFDQHTVARDWLTPDFTALAASIEQSSHELLRVEAHEIVSFPLLRDDVCEALIDEVANFAETGLPARRPNSMNNYGLILNEIGLRPSLNALQRAVAPVARAIFPLEGAELDNHHSFVVSYRADEDRGLDM